MKRSIESSILIQCSAEKVIPAFIEPEHLNKWWGIQNSYIIPKMGGSYILIWLQTEEGIKFIQTSKISLLNIRSELQLEDVIYINADKGIQGPFNLRIEAKAHDNETWVTIVQSGFEKHSSQEWYYNLMSDSWPEVLLFLKQYLESFGD